MSLSQSATSEANHNFKMADSQRSSRLGNQKKSLPYNNYNHHSQAAITNSASSKGTPSF